MKKLKRIVCGVLSVALAISIAQVCGSTPVRATGTQGQWSVINNASAYTKGNYIFYNTKTKAADSDNPLADFAGFFCSYASDNDFANAYTPAPPKSFLYGFEQTNNGGIPTFQTSSSKNIDSLGNSCSTYDNGKIIASGGSASSAQLYPLSSYIKSQHNINIEGTAAKVAKTLRSLYVEQMIFSDFNFGDLGSANYSTLLESYKYAVKIQVNITDSTVNQELINSIAAFKTNIDTISTSTNVKIIVEINASNSSLASGLVIPDYSNILDWKVNGESITTTTSSSGEANAKNLITCDKDSASNNVMDCYVSNPTADVKYYTFQRTNSNNVRFESIGVNIAPYSRIPFTAHIGLYEYPGLSSMSYERFVPKGTQVSMRQDGQLFPCPQGSSPITGTETCMYDNDAIIPDSTTKLVDDARFTLKQRNDNNELITVEEYENK